MQIAFTTIMWITIKLVLCRICKSSTYRSITFLAISHTLAVDVVYIKKTSALGFSVHALVITPAVVSGTAGFK
jgi:hypothetical protein